MNVSVESFIISQVLTIALLISMTMIGFGVSFLSALSFAAAFSISQILLSFLVGFFIAERAM